MFIIIGLLTLLYVQKIIRVWIGTRWTVSTIQDGILPVSDYPEIYVLLPLYQEASIIGEAIEHFSKFKYPKTHHHIILVTTEREDIQLKGKQPSTYALAKEILEQKDFPHISIFHASSLATCKADQLNEAVAYLQKTGIDYSAFIGVYDADSRPDHRTLSYMSSQIAEHRQSSCAFQQAPIYVHNYLEQNNYILRARPFLHNAYYFFSTELPHYLTSCGEFPVSLLLHSGAALTHFTGHGEFIRLDVLYKAGSFHPPSCDTSLGHDLAYLDIPIRPIPYFDNSQTPTRLSIFFNQNKVWFNGVMFFGREFRRNFANMREKGHLLKGLYMTLRVLNDNLAWALYPWLLLGMLIYLLLSQQYLAFISLLCVVHLPCVSIAIIMKSYKKIRELSGEEVGLPHIQLSEMLLMLLCFFPQRIINAIGPLLWLHSIFKQWVLGQQMEIQKTERQ